jgi:predicted transcriptional regulator
MSTTTIRLSNELKARVSRVAEDAGTTTHNFILEAIAEKTESVERRSAFVAEARARYQAILDGAATLPWAEVRKQWMATLPAIDGKTP